MAEVLPGFLRRLRRRSPGEIAGRASQLLRARLEALGASRRTRLPDEGAFLDSLRGPRVGSAEALLAEFRSPRRPALLPAFRDPEGTVRRAGTRWPGHVDDVVERADRVLRGSFDLLGHSGLDFGDPVDWHLDPVHGVRAPRVHWSRVDFLDPSEAGDHKLIWELNRHQFLVTLGQAYWLTGDEAYASAAVRHLDSWMDQNPPGTGVNWASSLEVAFRSVAWAWTLHLIRASDSLAPGVHLRALAFLHRHGQHVERYLSRWFSPNTHLTGEALGLVYLGLAFPELPAAGRWARRGREILVAELERQVRPDGVYFEHATCYHRYTTDFYLHLRVLADHHGVPLPGQVDDELEGLLDHLAFLTGPDGRTPQIGDDDGGRLLFLEHRDADDFRPTLATGAVLRGRPDWLHVAGGASPEALWLLGPRAVEAADAVSPRPPAEASRSFPRGGFHVMRESWDRDASYVVVRCGRHGALRGGHAHADQLAVVAHHRGRPLLVDSGTLAYTTDPAARDAFRSTEAHNTVTVSGRPSAVPGGPFSWEHTATGRREAWIATGRFALFGGRHDGYRRLRPPADHHRSVLALWGDYMAIWDRVPGQGGRPAAAHFHFAPCWRVERSGGGLEARPAGTDVRRPRPGGPGAGGAPAEVEAAGERGEDEAVRMSFHGDVADARLTTGRVSPVYGVRREAPVATVELAGVDDGELLSLLLPEGAEAEEAATGDGGRLVRIRSPGGDDLLAASAAGVRAGGLATDASLAWVRRAPDTGAVREFLLVGGRRLAVGGREVASAADRLPWLAAGVSDGVLRVRGELTSPVELRVPGVDAARVEGPGAELRDGAVRIDRPGAPAGAGRDGSRTPAGGGG